MSYGYVYKITYPNGKIYVGSDTQTAAADCLFTYFGSTSVGRRIAAENAALRRDFKVRKQVLWESDTASRIEVTAMERQWIRETGANNPAIGYNLTPPFRST
jgi:hypothetical protein